MPPPSNSALQIVHLICCIELKAASLEVLPPSYTALKIVCLGCFVELEAARVEVVVPKLVLEQSVLPKSSAASDLATPVSLGPSEPPHLRCLYLALQCYWCILMALFIFSEEGTVPIAQAAAAGIADIVAALNLPALYSLSAPL